MNIKTCFGISSCKGGVGKSTVACNIAITLANQGYKVGLLDADIYGPSVPTLLGIQDKEPEVASVAAALIISLCHTQLALFVHHTKPSTRDSTDRE